MSRECVLAITSRKPGNSMVLVSSGLLRHWLMRILGVTSVDQLKTIRPEANTDDDTGTLTGQGLRMSLY